MILIRTFVVKGPLTPEERIDFAARNEPKKVMEEFNSRPRGHYNEEVTTSRIQYGRNMVTNRNKHIVLKRLYHAFVNVFTTVLAALALFSYFVADGGLPPLVVITTLIIVSGILTFVQETKSGKSAAKLISMVSTIITVRREGVEIEIDSRELVVGDIICLDTGDVIPADVRLISSSHLQVDESALTGESGGVTKDADISDKDSELAHSNMAYMGTNVIGGSAEAIVVAVGDDTVFGSMTDKFSGKRSSTTYDKGSKAVLAVLLKIMVVLIPIVFVISVLKGNVTIPEALILAVALAIGLMPEMLPTIVSANLAKGAVEMSKNKVIVKDMTSIQNFGAMDVLCTDKTGTITQNRISVESTHDVYGNKNEWVGILSYLNSSNLSSATNQIDWAIDEYAEDAGIADSCEGYEFAGDVPFDFIRRRASVVVKKDEKCTFISKGAIQEMLAISNAYEAEGGIIKELTPRAVNDILGLTEWYSSKGMRVLGVAYKPVSDGNVTAESEFGLIFSGFIVFLDPIKETAKDAVEKLREHGVGVKVLTGDNEFVTEYVCEGIGISVDEVLVGSNIDKMDDASLKEAVEKVDVFVRLTPQNKAHIVTALRDNGHTVGLLGDGINDVVAMRAADVSISVDTAADITKETADMILLEKDLGILREGAVEGRKVYANTIKYVKMTSSANFGYMISLIIATIFFDFEPMTSMQILVFNLIVDISCIAIPWDKVEDYYVKQPRKWDSVSLKNIFTRFGPLSTMTDIITFSLLTFMICPMFVGQYIDDPEAYAALFQTCWFVENFWMQVQIIHILRTPKVPFFQSWASKPVLFASLMALIVGTLMPFTPIGSFLGMVAMPWQFMVFLPFIGLSYFIAAYFVKKEYLKKFGELL